MNSSIQKLLQNHPIISDQVDMRELVIILEQLSAAIQATTHGDIVEFGCYCGTTSLFMQRYLLETNTNRALHVYDSFEGLPPKTLEDLSPAGEQFKAGELSSSKKDFLQNFKKANLRPPIVHKGWFENFSQKDIPDSVAFAFLDGDYYSSIKTSLELIENRLVKGAIVVVDDYTSEALPGAQKAVDEWIEARPEYTVTHSASLAIIRDGKAGRR